MGLLSEGYVKIESDTQLAYYEHVLEHLAAREVSALFILDNIVAIIALLLSIGAMMTSFTQNENLHSWYVQLPMVVVLLVALGYGVYAEYTHRKEKQELPKMVAIVQNAIECYKKNKGKQMKIQMQINCEFDLYEIKSNLENKKQLLNNEIVLDYVKKYLLEDSINSAKFTEISTEKSGNKGFLNQQISAFNKEFSI